jgi:hypothetical protein
MTKLRSLIPLVLLCLLAFPVTAEAGDKPQDIYDAAGKAYYEGQKCVRRGGQVGANAFIENEKAIGHLEQSQRLMEKYLLLKPDDGEAERLMTEILALLFFCHKMSPMVDPEDIPEDTEEDEAVGEDAEETGPTEEEEAAQRAREEAEEAEAKAEASAQNETKASELLEQARAYKSENPKEGMNALTKFFFVAETYPDTEAGKAARAEAEALQGTLFAVKMKVAKKISIKPLTAGDKKSIEKQLKTWLSNRQKVRCGSCKGAGFKECGKCGGSGKIQGRAGRRSTCSKCKRGKIYCKRKACSTGIDTRFLEKVVVGSRAPHFEEKLLALLGGGKKALPNFLSALAATLSGSPRAPAEISRCATELGIAPVQLRDVIENHGPTEAIVARFKSYSVKKVGRKTSYELKGEDAGREKVSFEQTPDGKWWVRDFSD